ncbi:hypothetical protein PXNS11_210132 [Stutzerimonas xanthomarina]|nr:hypothetical protein PXNS11_210132 [Stutzerimonas xanthomarina]
MASSVAGLVCSGGRDSGQAGGRFPSPQPSPQRGEGVDPVLLAVWWSGVALVLLVRSLWYVVAEELGWASFPSPQSSPQRGEGVDPVLLAVFVIWRCFGAVSPEPLVCVVARHLVGSLPLTPALSPKGRGG